MRPLRAMNDPNPADRQLKEADFGSPRTPENLNIETLRQWQADLEGFVSQIRRRIKSLSQAMKNHRVRRKGSQQPEPLPSGASDQHEQPVIDQPHPSAPTEHTASPSGAPPAPPVNENDPLAQLDAIKRRLAEQLENT